MEYKIIEILDNNKKNEYADIILRKLPEWFGNEKSIQNYVNTVFEYPFWAAFDNNNCIGFFLGKFIIIGLEIFMFAALTRIIMGKE